MYVFIAILVISVYLKKFIPSKGFLCDEKIEKLTYFGSARTYELRDITEVGPEAFIVLKPVNAEEHKYKFERNREDQQATEQSSTPVDSGIDLDDINAKSQQEVDMSNMYTNIDESDEDLSSMIGRVFNNGK